MKNIPDQLKMLKDLRDSGSISESEYEKMLEILLQELGEQNEQLKEQVAYSSQETTFKGDAPEPSLFEPSINAESETQSLFKKAKRAINAAQIFTVIFGIFLVSAFTLWHKFFSKEGFWEQLVFFTAIIFLLGTVNESKLTAWIYKQFSAILNLTIYSKNKIQENIHVDDPSYVYISDYRNADAQRVLNKIIQYFFLYRFVLIIIYKVLVNLFLERIILFEKIVFFEQLEISGIIFYYELLILICIKLYLILKAYHGGFKLKNELVFSFSKTEMKKTHDLNPQLQFLIPNETGNYFGPFNRNQMKLFIGLKLVKTDQQMKNGYGTNVEPYQFVN